MTRDRARKLVKDYLLSCPLGAELTRRQKAVRAALDAHKALSVDDVPLEQIDEFMKKTGIPH
jgi:hypothetical protein